VEYWSDRTRRWFAIGSTSVLLGLGGLAGVEIALAAIVAAPFLAGLLSGRTLVATISLAFGVFAVAWFMLWSLDGPTLAVFIGVAGSFVLQSETFVQIVARLFASVVAGFAVWNLLGTPNDLGSLAITTAPVLIALGLADELADLLAGGRDLAVDLDLLSGASTAKKLAVSSWASFVLAFLTFWLGIGGGLPGLFVVTALVAGVAGGVASFSTPPAEGEVRAANFAMSMTPVLIIVGLLALLLVALSTIEWTLF
jgi:hypothetical protein